MKYISISVFYPFILVMILFNTCIAEEGKIYLDDIVIQLFNKCIDDTAKDKMVTFAILNIPISTKFVDRLNLKGRKYTEYSIDKINDRDVQVIEILEYSSSADETPGSLASIGSVTIAVSCLEPGSVHYWKHIKYSLDCSGPTVNAGPKCCHSAEQMGASLTRAAEQKVATESVATL